MTDEFTRLQPARVDQQPFFSPWIGDEYKRVRAAGASECCVPTWHIMGESHYGGDRDARAELTGDVMRDLAMPGYEFFDTVLSIATGKPVSELDRQADWQSFAFSNFVQDLLEPGGRPSPEQWARARRAFFGQLAITRPKLLLVVGKEAWDQTPAEGATRLGPVRLVDDSADIDDLYLYSYEHDGEVHHTIATWIYHPSSRGHLNRDDAALKVRSVGMHVCNTFSQLEKQGDSWVLERW